MCITKNWYPSRESNPETSDSKSDRFAILRREVYGTDEGTCTHTSIAEQRSLSPLRLLIPPHRYIWWFPRESNPARLGLQPNALPTELENHFGAHPRTRTLKHLILRQAAIPIRADRHGVNTENRTQISRATT